MVEEVRLPEISENVETGEVIDVLVKVGDFIELEQSVVELETEKAVFEVPSTAKGKVVEINVEQGQEVKVGQTLVKIDTDAQPGQEKAAPAEILKSKEKEPAAKKITAEKPPSKEKTPQADIKQPAPEQNFFAQLSYKNI